MFYAITFKDNIISIQIHKIRGVMHTLQELVQSSVHIELNKLELDVTT